MNPFESRILDAILRTAARNQEERVVEAVRFDVGSSRADADKGGKPVKVGPSSDWSADVLGIPQAATANELRIRVQP